MTAKRAISYIRASTSEEMQPNSLAVQMSILNNFAKVHGYEFVQNFVEYQSGTDDERVEFNKALQTAIDEDLTLICIRVDRLARSLSIFSKIQDQLHRLRFCELGDTEPNLMVLSVLLAVAKQEAINTSTRIRATFKALKDANPNRKFGNPHMATDVQPLGQATRVANAKKFNDRIKLICNDLRSAGYCTIPQLVVALERLEIKSRRGRPINYANLYRILNHGE